MEVIVAPTYEAMSQQAAQDVIRLMRTAKNPLLCVASGDSPKGLYQQLVQQVNAASLDFSNWKFVGLDEWIGMNEQDEGSCRYHVNQQLFHPLHIKKENIFFFDGRHPDIEKHCADTEQFIEDNGGIDVAIIGVGLNGHIGMNEPGTDPLLHTHLSAIDPETQTVGQKYFNTPQVITHGITLGIANILAAKHIFLLATGAHKAAIVKKILQDEISDQLPASFLRQHKGFRIYLDAAAAAMI